MTVTRRNLDEVRRLLVRQRELIDENKRLERLAVREGSEALHETVCDEGESSQLDEQVDVDLTILEMNSETARELDRAIERLDNGSYGTCQACGGGISAARLRALPFATLCLGCALEVEHGADVSTSHPLAAAL